MYSYTKPNKKRFFQEDTRLWLIFLSAITSLFIIFSLFITIEGYSYKRKSKLYKEENLQLTKDNKELNKKIKFILKQKEIYTNIALNNSMLKDSVKNVLNLIPDPITLNKVIIKDKSLELYGVTPTKDVFNILLLPALQSIFTSTNVEFYLMKNGWYNFYSKNEINNETEN